jgi:hypothetical protein
MTDAESLARSYLCYSIKDAVKVVKCHLKVPYLVST